MNGGVRSTTRRSERPAISGGSDAPLRGAAAVTLAVVTAGLLNFPGSFSCNRSPVFRQPTFGATPAPEALPVEILPGMTTRVGIGGCRGAGRCPDSAALLLSPDRLTNYLVYHGEYSGLMSTKVVDSHIVNQRPYVITVNTVSGCP